MDHRGRGQLNGCGPATVSDGGFGRTGGGCGSIICRTGTGHAASSARVDNSGSGAAGSGADIGSDITCGTGTCSGSGPTTETLVRRRREICWVLRSGRIFA